MRPTRHAITLATAMVLLVALSPVAAQASPGRGSSLASTATPPGAGSVDHATLVGAAGTDAGQVVLVVGEYGREGYRSGYQALVRAADGTWSPPVELAERRLSSFSATSAFASDGSGVVAWDDYAGHGPPVLWARVRHADGTWEPPRVMIRGGGASAGVGQVVASPGGHAAVLYSDHGGQPVVAVDDDGTWSELHTPLGEPWSPQVALDAEGGLHVVLKSDPHGGGGTVKLTRRAVGADRWTVPETVPTPYLSSGAVQLALDGRGRELLLYEYVAHNGYVVPGDTDLVGGTASRLLGQREVGGPLRTLWDRSGATAATVSTAGGAVRLTWTQWVGHLPHGGHRATKLRTRLLGKHGTTLAETAAGTYWPHAAGGAPGAVTWLSPQRHTRQLLAVPVGRQRGSGDPVVLDDHTQEPTWWRSAPALAQLLLVGGQPWAAWENAEVLDADHREQVDSRVSVAPLTG